MCTLLYLCGLFPFNSKFHAYSDQIKKSIYVIHSLEKVRYQTALLNGGRWPCSGLFLPLPPPDTARYPQVFLHHETKTRNNKRPTNRKFAAVSKIKDKSLNKTSNEHTWFDRWPFLLGNSSVLERYTRDCEQQTGGLAPPSRIKIMEHKLGHICCLFTFCFERGYLLII